MCEQLQEEMFELRRCKDEMANVIDILENKVEVLEEENAMLKDENIKIAKFAKGLDREIENVVAYLEKKQDE